MQYRVAMKECAAAAVLSGEANGIALLHQTRVGEILGATPVQCELAIHHFLARLHDGEHPRMQFPIRGIAGDRFAQDPKPGQLHARLHRLPIRVQVLAPINGIAIADQPECRARLRLAFIQAAAVLLHHRRGFRRS